MAFEEQLAIITDQWNTLGGGSEVYLVDLVQELLHRGVNVRVYCRSLKAESTRAVHRIPSPRFPKFLQEWSFCRNSIRIASQRGAATLLSTRAVPGATHCQLPAGLYADAFAAEHEAMESSLRKSIYPVCNALNAKRRTLVALEQRTLEGPALPKLMVNSDMVRQRLVRQFGLLPEAIQNVQNGINLLHFKPAPPSRMERTGGEDSKALKLLFVAHNFLLKGLHCLFAAMSVARRRGVETLLQVVGNGDIRGFHKIAVALGISSQVSFRGHVDRRALPDCYRNSDVLVHPAFYDPCSLVVLEALACGCPVITTRRNGASELIEHGCEGFVLDDPRNTEGMVEVFGKLLDRERALQMRLAAASRGQSFELSSHVDKVMEWLGLSGEWSTNYTNHTNHTNLNFQTSNS